MNQELMSEDITGKDKEQQEEQQSEVEQEQTGKIADEVLDAVSGGAWGVNPDGTPRFGNMTM